MATETQLYRPSSAAVTRTAGLHVSRRRILHTTLTYVCCCSAAPC